MRAIMIVALEQSSIFGEETWGKYGPFHSGKFAAKTWQDKASPAENCTNLSYTAATMTEFWSVKFKQ